MSLDGMRVGSGRCPPIFVGGLLLSCLLLVCNWWSLSTENLELLRQIDELGDQLKISAEERDQCVTQRVNVQQRYTRLEGDLGVAQVRLLQLNEMKAQNEQLSESLTMCKSELESLNKLDTTKRATLEALRLDKDALTLQLKTKEDESIRLKADLEAAIDEAAKLKTLADVSPEKKEPKTKDSPLQLAQGVRPSLTFGQLPPVPESAVNITVSGKRGIEYHGIPILPTDPPGAIRPSPRFSVSLLKAQTSEPKKEKIAVDVDANKYDDNAAEVEPSGLENRFERPDEISIQKPLDERQ